MCRGQEGRFGIGLSCLVSIYLRGASYEPGESCARLPESLLSVYGMICEEKFLWKQRGEGYVIKSSLSKFPLARFPQGPWGLGSPWSQQLFAIL